MILFPLSPAFGGIIRVPIGIELSAKRIALKDKPVEMVFMLCVMRYALCDVAIFLKPRKPCTLNISDLACHIFKKE